MVYGLVFMCFCMVWKVKSGLGRQFPGFKPSAALSCYDLDEIWDGLEGEKLVWTTVSRF